MKWHKLIAKVDAYFESWRALPFTPILYIIIWGAAIRLSFIKIEEIPFSEIFADWVYHVWLVLGMICPMTAGIAWYLIHQCWGRLRYFGLWVRLSADLGVFTVILTYHITVVMVNPSNPSRIYSRYIVAAAMLFVMALAVRDIWSIRSNEKQAARIRNGR